MDRRAVIIHGAQAPSACFAQGRALGRLPVSVGYGCLTTYVRHQGAPVRHEDDGRQLKRQPKAGDAAIGRDGLTTGRADLRRRPHTAGHRDVSVIYSGIASRPIDLSKPHSGRSSNGARLVRPTPQDEPERCPSIGCPRLASPALAWPALRGPDPAPQHHHRIGMEGRCCRMHAFLLGTAGLSTARGVGSRRTFWPVRLPPPHAANPVLPSSRTTEP
jgi:hypothetical protein